MDGLKVIAVIAEQASSAGNTCKTQHTHTKQAEICENNCIKWLWLQLIRKASGFSLYE